MAEIPHYGTVEGRRHADFLLTRARRGDRHAFDQLIEIYTPLLENVAHNFLPDGLVDRDDLRQEVLIAAWVAVRKFKPKEGTFPSFLSKIASDALAADLQHRRRLRRWTERGNVSSAETGGVDGEAMELAAASWMFGADPVRVVIAREDMRRGWLSLRAHHQAALNEYLTHEETMEPALRSQVQQARRFALRVIHGELDKRCAVCNQWIPLERARKPTVRTCSDECGRDLQRERDRAGERARSEARRLAAAA